MFTSQGVKQFVFKFLFRKMMHTVPWVACNRTCMCRQAHKQFYLCNLLHTQNHNIFSFCFVIIDFPQGEPSEMWCSLFMEKKFVWTVKLKRRPFKRKYFMISVANQLNQNSFMNWLFMESSKYSYSYLATTDFFV